MPYLETHNYIYDSNKDLSFLKNKCVVKFVQHKDYLNTNEDLMFQQVVANEFLSYIKLRKSI